VNTEVAVTTSSIKKIQSLLDELDKNSLRYQILSTALQFKTNWVDLGKHLYQVYKSEQFREWGYSSFQKYCSQEIGIKQATADKLTTSYYYLEKHEPKLLNQYKTKDRPEIPDYETVNCLAKIREDKNVCEEKYEEFKEAAFDEGCSDKVIKRRYGNFLKDLEHDENIEDEETGLSEKDIASLISAFERIDRKIEDLPALPVDIKTDIRKLLARLKALPDQI
jgi:hypothetical protein